MLGGRLLSFVALMLSAATGSAEPTSQRWVTLDLGASISAPAGAIGASYGDGTWFARAEWNPWVGLSSRSFLEPGAMNLTAGREWLLANGRFRSALAVGLSTLFFDTVLHERGRTGLSLQWTPLSWRLPAKRYRLRIEPISLHVAMPILSGIPLMVPQYRHSVGFEWAL
ncbi:MAG: hypothetical protein VYB65_12735 [Myxococcota bacterium]|nr:hypothetical protein [Myxococcota bacterium]